jgi:hypothetical protein
MEAVAGCARAIPESRVPFLAAIGLECLAQDPEPSAAVLSGILYGRVAPDHRERCSLQAPAMVIGHHRDPVHPFSDAGMLATELPNAQLVQANSIIELRLRPQRLTGTIAQFIHECWNGRAPGTGGEMAGRNPSAG